MSGGWEIFKETLNINRSLLSLEECLSTLESYKQVDSTPNKAKPYKNSILTRFLWNTLLICKCYIIINLNPHSQESLSSLTFGSRLNIFRSQKKSEEEPIQFTGEVARLKKLLEKEKADKT